jgi:hypothetical protein
MADKNGTSPASAEPPAEPATTNPPAASAAPAVATVAAPKKSWTRYLTPALALVAALIVGGVAGVLIGQNTASASNASSLRGGFPNGGEGLPGFGGGQGGAGTGNGAAAGGRGGFTAGTITSIDGGTITLKLTDGSTVKVSTSDSTTVTKSSTAKVSDLSTGETITVVGQPDSSGDVTATRISEGDAGFGGFGGARPSGAPTAAPTN